MKIGMGLGCSWSICRDAPKVQPIMASYSEATGHSRSILHISVCECATTRLNFIVVHVVVVVVMADNVDHGPEAPATLPPAFKRRRPKPLGDSWFTLAGRERRPMGRIPKPLAEKVKLWKFDKPRTRHGITYPLERKMEVLVFLVKKRFAEPYTKRKRVRVGQELDDDAVHAIAPDGREFMVRPPTYQEAAEWWHIPLGTIQKWWDNRDKILEGSGIVLADIEPEEPTFPDHPLPEPEPTAEPTPDPTPSTKLTPKSPTPVSSQQAQPKQVPMLNQVVFVGPIPASGTFIHHPSAIGNYPPPSSDGPPAWVVVYGM